MREGFYIGPLLIHYYGIIIMFGVLIAAWLSTAEAKRRGIDPDMVWDMLPWILIGGILGARLWHILTPPPSMVAQGITTMYYLTHPLDAMAIWNGGLGIPGAVMGGLIALFFYARVKKTSFLMWADIVAPGLALAQAIGRWGNYVNQELYGAPSNLPWAIFIQSSRRLPGFENQATYQPLFAYECIWNLLNMTFLLWVGRKYSSWLKTGDIFLIYMIFYSVGRFVLEFLRLDASQLAGLNANQTLMGMIFVGSTATLIWRHFSHPKTNMDQPEQTASE